MVQLLGCEIVECSRAALDEELVGPAGVEPTMARHCPELVDELLLPQFRRLQQSNWKLYSSLRAPDRKDVDKPDKYSGDVTDWLTWSKSFTRFLRRHDWRWPGLLEKVQELRGKPETAEDEKRWA